MIRFFVYNFSELSFEFEVLLLSRCSEGKVLKATKLFIIIV